MKIVNVYSELEEITLALSSPVIVLNVLSKDNEVCVGDQLCLAYKHGLMRKFKVIKVQSLIQGKQYQLDGRGLSSRGEDNCYVTAWEILDNLTFSKRPMLKEIYDLPISIIQAQ